MANEAPVTFKVLSTLAAYRVVALDTAAANTVVYPPSSARQFIGITADTVKDTLNSIPIYLNGIAKLFFNDTVSCGALVAADSSGRGIPFVEGATTSANTVGASFIGVACRTVSATGTIADVVVMPGRAKGTS